MLQKNLLHNPVLDTLDQGVSCFSEAVACNQAVLAKLEPPWARCVD
jgi:hypothetical protein